VRQTQLLFCEVCTRRPTCNVFDPRRFKGSPRGFKNGLTNNRVFYYWHLLDAEDSIEERADYLGTRAILFYCSFGGKTDLQRPKFKRFSGLCSRFKVVPHLGAGQMCFRSELAQWL
jgi:hypothetical protein